MASNAPNNSENTDNPEVVYTQENLENSGSACASGAPDDDNSELVETVVISEFGFTDEISSLERSASDGGLWLCSLDSKFISLVSKYGKVTLRVNMPSPVMDMSISPITGNLWCCCLGDTFLYEIMNSVANKRFKVDGNPWSICVTPESTIVVGIWEKIIVYDVNGSIRYNLPTSGKQLVSNPARVAVCSRTGDIAVCDTDDVEGGGSGEPRITTFDSTLKLKHQFFGVPSEERCEDFRPSDVVFDSAGRLLVVDINNKRILLVSGEELLFVLYNADVKIKGISLLDDDLLAVASTDKRIKLVQYS